MKKILFLLILCMLYSINTYSQRTDITVQALLLVSDTAKKCDTYFSTVYAVYNEVNIDSTVSYTDYITLSSFELPDNYNSSVFWVKGYEVITKDLPKKGYINDDKFVVYDDNLYIHVKYLDAEKHTLSRNYVVWQKILRE